MRKHTALFTVVGISLALGAASCRSSKGPQSYVATRTQSGGSFAGVASKQVLRAAMHYPKKELKPVQQVPMSLTASDGTGLKLVSLEGRAVVQGPLAFTELHLKFHNPEPRQREGRFNITLPTGATVSRFAMKLHSGWQEAEVVERQRARQIYEDFLHRKQDPALLEKKAGNAFRARIFPIPASGHKEIKISYSQQLAAPEQPYTLSLRGLPRMESLRITAFVGEQVATKQAASSLGGVTMSHKVVKVNKSNYAPDQDFVVAQSSQLAGLRNGNLALVRVKPDVTSKPAAMASVMLLVDTSASRAAGFYRQVEQLGALVQHLKKAYSDDVSLHVAAFDQQVDTIFSGPMGAFGRQDLDALLARRPLGASNLHRALTWVAKQGKVQRLVLVSDGIATAGKTEAADLRAAVGQLESGGVKRLDVVLVGGIRDEAGMRSLVAGTLPNDGVVLDGAKPAGGLAARLARQTVSGIRVAVPGAKWVWPRRLNGVQSGDHVLVFADLPAGALAAGKQITVNLSGPLSQKVAATMAAVKRPLLERAWVKARIAHLEQQRGSGELDPDLGKAILQQIITLSKKHRVLSDHTALLVLETERDYARYNIARNALADILVVGASGVEVMQRGAQKTPVVRPPVVRRPPPVRRPFRSRDKDGRSLNFSPDDAVAGQGAAEQEQTARPDSAPRGKRTAGPRLSVRSQPRPVEAAKSVMRVSPAKPRPRPRPAASPAPPASGALLADPAMEARPEPRRTSSAGEDRADSKNKQQGPPALSGKLAAITALIKAGKVEQALVDALRWRAEQPGNVMALLALGEALQAYGRPALAARVYGSIIDLFPSRADMRRFAGERLEALGNPGFELAADSYTQAVKQRPDHALGHRLLAYALVRLGQHDKALAALEAGLTQRYRIGRRGVLRIMREDLGLVAAAMAAKQPNSRAALMRRLAKHSASIAAEPSTRFVLTWETDANDVDFHIHDGQGGHAYYSRKTLPTGGSLYADVTNGYGPECFTINGTPRAYPYQLKIHYYSRGPMGYGMGKLQVLEHDGKGGLSFEDRPFVVMNDRAYVDLGLVKRPGK